MSKDKRCIHVADSQAAAQGISLWLDRHGIENIVVNKTTLGFSHGVSFSSNDPAGDGWQVWVRELAQCDLAREILAERESEKQKQQELGETAAVCEACGETAHFPGKYRGSIQNCPSCGRFLDVPGGEDRFDWPDEFNEEDQN